MKLLKRIQKSILFKLQNLCYICYVMFLFHSNTDSGNIYQNEEAALLSLQRVWCLVVCFLYIKLGAKQYNYVLEAVKYYCTFVQQRLGASHLSQPAEELLLSGSGRSKTGNDPMNDTLENYFHTLVNIRSLLNFTLKTVL